MSMSLKQLRPDGPIFIYRFKNLNDQAIMFYLFNNQSGVLRLWLEQRTKIHVKECNSSIPIYDNMFF